MKLLPSSHFVRIGSPVGQLLSGLAFVWWSNCLEYRYLQKSSFDRSRYFCTASAFSEELHFPKTFFGRGTFSERPLSQKTLSSNLFRRATFSQHTFSEKLLFHGYTSSPQLHYYLSASN